LIGRIRSLKPEWLEDELLVMCSSDARTLSVALILLADDYGNGRAGRVQLSGRVFPLSESLDTLDKALGELVRIRYAGIYNADGQSYFSIRNWDKHQRVDKPGKPRVPGPPDNLFEKVPETLAKVPDSLAPDQDLDQDQDHDRPASPKRAGSTSNKPVPLDANWQPTPELVEALTAKHGVDPGRIRQIVPEFRWYWIHGKGSGKRRSEKGWQQTFSNRVGQMAKTEELYAGPRTGQQETAQGAIRWAE